VINDITVVKSVLYADLSQTTPASLIKQLGSPCYLWKC